MIDAVLTEILTAAPPAQPIEDAATWWRGHVAATAAFSTPLERAIAGGFVADRPAWAFASGYQEAMQRLVPELFGIL